LCRTVRGGGPAPSNWARPLRIAAALPAALLTAGLAALPFPGLADEPADLVLVNGRIYTPSGWQGAMAVRDGRIVGTGTAAEVRQLAKPGAEERDLGGRAVFPGLFDMHVHPLNAGLGRNRRCLIRQGADAGELLEGLRVCVAAKRPGEWVTGGQWQAHSLGDTPITRGTLDLVSPANPVVLYDISGHSVWINSIAMQAAGITRDTPDPPQGVIERDASGEPTGVLREAARDLVLSRVPPPSPEENLAALRRSLAELLSRGVTGLVDAMVFRPQLVAYAALADAGELHQVVRACLAFSHAGKPVPEFEALLAERESFARSGLKPDCVKVFMDGVPTESRTAAMLEPYAGGRGAAIERGRLLIDPQLLNPAVARWDRLGLSVLFHAAGDGAVRASLDAIEFARNANGGGGPRHQVGHSTFVAPKDLPRARPLDATFEFSPYLWFPSPINDDIFKAVGARRVARVWPLREALQAGALVVVGSDWSVVPDPDPWLAIETSMTRRAPGGDGAAYGAREAISLAQALELYTANAAKHLGLAERLGTLEAGKEATFIVVDRNPFDLPVTRVHTVEVEETWVAGQKVFDRGCGRVTDGSAERSSC
jgi:hypothetical protein